MAKFLRMEKAETGQCFTLNYEKRCYFHDGIRKRMGKECEHCGNDIVYIEDTVIPQKLALYDEMLAIIKDAIDVTTVLKVKPQIVRLTLKGGQSIIDRAKKIEEEGK